MIGRTVAGAIDGDGVGCSWDVAGLTLGLDFVFAVIGPGLVIALPVLALPITWLRVVATIMYEGEMKNQAGRVSDFRNQMVRYPTLPHRPQVSGPLKSQYMVHPLDSDIPYQSTYPPPPSSSSVNPSSPITYFPLSSPNSALLPASPGGGISSPGNISGNGLRGKDQPLLCGGMRKGNNSVRGE